MSDCTDFGTFHEMSGSRRKPPIEKTRLFIAERIFCWRRARVRSSSRRLHRFSRVRVPGSPRGGGGAGPLPPVVVGGPAPQARCVAPFFEAAVDARDAAPAG